MPMPSYPVYCSSKACKNLATHKIAAQWSDGAHKDLKTYALCCPECLPAEFALSLQKHDLCRVLPGETLESPGIYHLKRGARDIQLQRLDELEREIIPGY